MVQKGEIICNIVSGSDNVEAYTCRKEVVMGKKVNE
jgi:hypothetical protein